MVHIKLFNHLLSIIIISYLKPYSCVQMKPFNCVQKNT